MRYSAILLILGVFLGSVPSTPLSQTPPSSLADPAGKYVVVGDLRMYYEEKGSGAPVVFLHGGLGNFHSSFPTQIDDLARDHRVIGIEQVGHGHTADRDGPFDFRGMADDTAQLLKQLHVQGADFIGYSDGGILALLIARNHPELVRRLVVSGANISTSAEVQASLRKMSPEELAKKLPTEMRDDYEKISPDGPTHWIVVVEKAKNLSATPVIMETADVATIKARTLVVSGDHDAIPLPHTFEIFNALPNAQLCVLPGTGHHTFKDSPSVLNPVIRHFLTAE